MANLSLDKIEMKEGLLNGKSLSTLTSLTELYSGNLGVNANANLSLPYTDFKFIIFEFLSSAGNYVQEIISTEILSVWQANSYSFIINGTFNTSAVRYYLLRIDSSTSVHCIDRSSTQNLRIYGLN